MPRPPISKHWNDKIWEVRANEGVDWSAARMSRRLEEIAANESRNNPPHRTTVQRELDKITQDQKRLGEFRYVYWPESFGERGELPWEASAAVLELLAVTEEEEVPKTYGLARAVVLASFAVTAGGAVKETPPVGWRPCGDRYECGERGRPQQTLPGGRKKLPWFTTNRADIRCRRPPPQPREGAGGCLRHGWHTRPR